MYHNRVLCVCALGISVLSHVPQMLLSTKEVKYPATPVHTEITPASREQTEYIQKFLQLKIAPNYIKETKSEPLFFEADQDKLKVSPGLYASSVAEFVRTIVKTGLRSHQKAAYEHLRNQLENYQRGKTIRYKQALLEGLKEGLNEVE